MILVLSDQMMRTKPDDVKIVRDWGEITIVSHDKDLEIYTCGQHVMIDGPPESVKRWLAPFDGVWVGVGSPIMEEFEVRHIKEE